MPTATTVPSPSFRLVAGLAMAFLLLACTPMTTSNEIADVADSGLQPVHIPDQGLAKHKANPMQGYRIHMTIHDAPGPFGIVRAYAQYDVENNNDCGPIHPMTGTASRMTRLEPFALTKLSDTEYEGVVYADLMQDDDYYGLGVCRWEMVMARVVLQAGKETDTGFMATIDTPDLLAGKTIDSYFWKGRYPEVKDLPGYGAYGSARSENNRSDDELFHVALVSQEMQK